MEGVFLCMYVCVRLHIVLNGICCVRAECLIEATRGSVCCVRSLPLEVRAGF